MEGREAGGCGPLGVKWVGAHGPLEPSIAAVVGLLLADRGGVCLVHNSLPSAGEEEGKGE